MRPNFASLPLCGRKLQCSGRRKCGCGGAWCTLEETLLGFGSSGQCSPWSGHGRAAVQIAYSPASRPNSRSSDRSRDIHTPGGAYPATRCWLLEHSDWDKIGVVTLAVPSRFSVISWNTENQLTACQKKGTIVITFSWQYWHILHTYHISCCFR